MLAQEVRISQGLKTFMEEAVQEFDQISAERKGALRELVDFVSERVRDQEKARLTFICTHNSRRSHISQLWAQTAAYYYRVPGIETYSGGTESTAFNPRAVAAMRRAGFLIDAPNESGNPTYQVRFEPGMAPIECFSKVYDETPNPTEDFAAIMTCSSADEACPVVFGSAAHISLPFEDPKAFDGTDQETEKYDERCRQIAREMLYVFSSVTAL